MLFSVRKFFIWNDLNLPPLKKIYFYRIYYYYFIKGNNGSKTYIFGLFL